MIIGTCGFGNTGASAILDYLRGYDGLQIFDKFEFQLLHQADGINDLKYYLTQSRERIACNVAIQRFVRSQKKGFWAKRIKKMTGGTYTDWYTAYINEIVQTSWMGECSNYDPLDISNKASNNCLRFVQRIIHHGLARVNSFWHFPRYKPKYFSIMSEEEFDQITKKHINKLLELLGFDDESIVILDMAFSATNPTIGMEFFDDAKAIIVTRDPRDIYVSAKMHPEDSRFMPNMDPNKFTVFYRQMQKYTQSNANVLLVQYEDLIYRYIETTEMINDFLGIDHRPEKEFQYFDPTYSVKYTYRINLYEKYKGEIQSIEDQLEEYLYDFEQAIAPGENPRVLELKNKRRMEYKGFSLK